MKPAFGPRSDLRMMGEAIRLTCTAQRLALTPHVYRQALKAARPPSGAGYPFAYQREPRPHEAWTIGRVASVLEAHRATL